MKQLILRVSPELHQRIAARAAREGKSVNAWVSQLLDATVDADVRDDRLVRARAQLAAMGWLSDNDAPPVDEKTRRRAMAFLRPHGRAIMAELDADRNDR